MKLPRTYASSSSSYTSITNQALRPVLIRSSLLKCKSFRHLLGILARKIGPEKDLCL